MSKSTPSFVKPFLYALNRMQENESLRPIQYMERSRVLMVDRLGMEGVVPEAAFAHGSVGLIADHTHYFAGFAMMLQLRQGIAVSMRATDREDSRLVLEGRPEIFEFDRHNPTASPLERLVSALDMSHSRQVDIALVSAIPSALGVAYYASLAVALCRVVGEEETTAQRALERAAGCTLSRAHVIGASLADEGPFLLVDTLNGEFLKLEVPTGQRPGFALLDTGGLDDFPPSGMAERRKAAMAATESLSGSVFPQLTTLRDLEHKDLDRALDSVAAKHRPVIRYLVSANRNVQKLSVALRKSDWQFFGAILKMAHASQTTGWTTGRPVFADAVTEAERLSLEGIYGVVQTGEQGILLIAGQPFSLPAFIDTMRESHTNGPLHALIL